MDLRGVDLNLLLGLDALLSERNVTRAAARMSLGQSAMSATLGRLRKHFEDPLLVREGRSLVLTPTAEALEPLVREAVHAAWAVFGKPKGFDPLTDRRSFTVVASDYTAFVLLRPLISRLAETAPLQRINVTHAQIDFVEMLRTGAADVVILPVEVIPPGTVYAHRHLFTDRFVLVADKSQDLGGMVTPEQFARLPYIAFSGGPHPSFPDSQLEALVPARRVEMTTPGYVVMPMLVIGTQLVALVPERLVGSFLDHGYPLTVAEPPGPLRPLTETMIWSPRQTDDPGHRWLREQIAEQALTLQH